LEHNLATPPKDWALISAAPDSLENLPEVGTVLDPSVLENAAVSDTDLRTSLEAKLDTSLRPLTLLVDMTWILGIPSSGRAIETWGYVSETLSETRGMQIVSIYDKEKMIEEDLAAALRAHRRFLAPSGRHDNPFWLPGDLAREGSSDDQLRYYISSIVPDFANTASLDSEYSAAARGASPGWVSAGAGLLGSAVQSTRWHVHCLGELEVYTSGSTPVDWRVSGGSPVKTKLLFAYLLTRGARATHADQLAEVIWPDNRSEDDKRKRLHHTISSLRKVLGGKETIHRSGQQYRLMIPPGSWIDMERFEQLCRRGLALLTHDNLDAAYKVYAAAERLYRGDLFASLPVESLDYELEDWCMSRRTWLNSMAAKLNYDMSKVLRRTGQLNGALLHCQKSLEFDPTDENGNLEMVRVLLDQGRLDAVARHVKQFERISEANGIPMAASNFFKEYKKITMQ
jgi:DNA-binding SARP family transcriptional activator